MGKSVRRIEAGRAVTSPINAICFNRSALSSAVPKKNYGSLDSLRRTEHRGGKTVAVVTGFVEIGQAEQECLAKQKQKACGGGGTVTEGRIEI